LDTTRPVSHAKWGTPFRGIWLGSQLLATLVTLDVLVIAYVE